MLSLFLSQHWEAIEGFKMVCVLFGGGGGEGRDSGPSNKTAI